MGRLCYLMRSGNIFRKGWRAVWIMTARGVTISIRILPLWVFSLVWNKKTFFLKKRDALPARGVILRPSSTWRVQGTRGDYGESSSFYFNIHFRLLILGRGLKVTGERDYCLSNSIYFIPNHFPFLYRRLLNSSRGPLTSATWGHQVDALPPREAPQLFVFS